MAQMGDGVVFPQRGRYYHHLLQCAPYFLPLLASEDTTGYHFWSGDSCPSAEDRLVMQHERVDMDRMWFRRASRRLWNCDVLVCML